MSGLKDKSRRHDLTDRDRPFPGISMPTLAQTACMLEATHHFHGNLILVQHHLHWLVYVHILHINSTLAVAIVAVCKQMICML